MWSPGKLTLEVCLDREQYFHGDVIRVTVFINNKSRKTVRSIKVSIIQHTEVTLVSGHYSKTVASVESREACPVTPGSSLTRVLSLVPSSASNKDRRGIALDGMLKETDSNLACSTLNTTSDSIGILISYVVRARLILGTIGGDLTCDVPFTLNNIEPGCERQDSVSDDAFQQNKQILKQKEDLISTQRKLRRQITREMSADLVIEDFARRRQMSAEKSSSSIEVQGSQDDGKEVSQDKCPTL